MGQQRYDSLVFATGSGSWKLTCAVSLPVSFKAVAKLSRLVSESTTIQFNSFGWDNVSDNLTCRVLLTGLVADAGELRLSCSQDDFIYFLLDAATSLRAGFHVYLS